MEDVLKNKAWKEFFFGKEFDIIATQSGIDKINLNRKRGNIPYITRTENNNGFDCFICKQENYITDKPNVITIGLDTQTVFYQQTAFYTGQNIQILSNNFLNKYVALFLKPLMIKQMEKFNWGGNGATLTRLRRSKILLPINSEGQPDYAFMEEYMRDMERRKIEEYKAFINRRLEAKMGGGGKLLIINELDGEKWEEFVMEDIFNIQSGKRLIKAMMKRGKTPFIGASDANNGITEWISNVNVSLDKNILGVNYNGSVGETFYHSYNAIFSDDVKRFSLKEKEGNEHIYLFLKGVILKQKIKYEYGYKFNEERMKRQKIMLPVNSHGNPDYEYMEQYMRIKERESIERYLRYLGKKNK
jgi:hypothetical protein